MKLQYWNNWWLDLHDLSWSMNDRLGIDLSRNGGRRLIVLKLNETLWLAVGYRTAVIGQALRSVRFIITHGFLSSRGCCQGKEINWKISFAFFQLIECRVNWSFFCLVRKYFSLSHCSSNCFIRQLSFRVNFLILAKCPEMEIAHTSQRIISRFARGLWIHDR